MLDNAAAAAQVRRCCPVPGQLPGADHQPAAPAALDDALPCRWTLLPASEAARADAPRRPLAPAASRPTRGERDPLLGEVTGLCGYLPLALRIAAALLRHRPAWNLKHLCQLLGERHQHVLALFDEDRDLGAMFGLSYQSLTPGMQCSFRNLGLVPGPDLDAYAAAALTGTGLETAASQLEGLVDQPLLIATPPAATGCTTCCEPRPHPGRHRPRRGGALRPDASTTTAHRPSAAMAISRYPRPGPDGPAPASPPRCQPRGGQSLAARRARQPRSRLCARPNPRFARAHPGAGWGTGRVLRTDGPFTHALEIQRAAAETAERLAGPAQLADALTELGILRQLTGDLAAARGTLTRAAETPPRGTDSVRAKPTPWLNWGIVQLLTGDLAGAAGTHSRALEIYQLVGHRHGEADTLTDLGKVQRLTGDLRRSRRHVSAGPRDPPQHRPAQRRGLRPDRTGEGAASDRRPGLGRRCLVPGPGDIPR